MGIQLVTMNDGRIQLAAHGHSGKNMGIQLVTMNDGRIQLLHTATEVRTWGYSWSQ